MFLLSSEDELIFTDKHLGQGLQASETELPNESAGGKQGVGIFFPSRILSFVFIKISASSSLAQFNEAAMAQLEAIGFPTIGCQKALLATGNQNPKQPWNIYLGIWKIPVRYWPFYFEI